MTFDDVRKHPHKPWRWDGLSRNPNVTFDDVQKYPDKPWDWVRLSENPNITFDNVHNHPDKPWIWYCLSGNLFEKHPFFANRSPKMSKEKKSMLMEMEQMFDIPPGCDRRPIFAKGGVLYWEEWSQVQKANGE